MNTRCLQIVALAVAVYPAARAEAVEPESAAPKAGCTCASFRAAGLGWCENCNKGLVHGIRLNNRAIYDLVMGKPLDKKKKIECEKCRKAQSKGSVCAKCHFGYFNNRVFSSLFAHALARGTAPADKQFKCETCTASLREGRGGYCSRCNGGILAGRFFTGKSGFEKAQKAYSVLQFAVEKAKSCESCATAMLCDAACDKCKKTYKNGRELKD